jgi:hypothetical protein
VTPLVKRQSTFGTGFISFSAAVPQSPVLSIQGQNNVCLVTMGDSKMIMALASSGSQLPAVVSSQSATGNLEDLIPQVHTDMMADAASSSVEIVDGQSEDMEPRPRLQMSNPDETKTISTWLREVRALKPEALHIPSPDLMELELPGVKTYSCPFEQVPLYWDGKMYGVMEQTQTVDFTWSCMLYGTPEDLKPKLPYAILLGFLLRRDVHSDLRNRFRSFANVLFVAEGCVEEFDLKALAHLWSIREVRLPKITKKTEEEGLPHRQANGVKTADALLKIFAMGLDCRTCLVSDIEVHITPRVIAEQLINLSTTIDDRQFQGGAVLACNKSRTFWISRTPLCAPQSKVRGRIALQYSNRNQLFQGPCRSSSPIVRHQAQQRRSKTT